MRSALIALGLGLVVMGCSSGGEEATGADGTSRVAPESCGLLGVAEVERVIGDVSLDSQSGTSCTYVGAVESPGMFTVEEIETPTAASVEALAGSLHLVEVEGVDDQLFFTPEIGEYGYRMLVRVGGSASLLTLVRDWDPAEAQTKLTDLAQRVARNLEQRPFDNLVTVPAADCSRLDAASIAEVAGISPTDVAVGPLPGVTGCSAKIGDVATATVAFDQGVSSAESIRGSSESRTVDGVVTEVASRSIEGVGDAAVWFSVPSVPGSGELRFVAGGRGARVTVSAAPDDARAVELAVTLANASAMASE